MNAFQRSWEITKLSFDVMKKDKELFLFPILGGIFSVLLLIAMMFPLILTGFLPDTLSAAFFWIAIFVIYFGLAFISIFFNVAAVYTIKTRFDGKNATFWDSIKFALSKIHLIIGWSIISAIVGLILRILEEIADRMGGVGEIILRVIVGLLGLAWSLVTAFVIPSMVYKNIGPISAIKESSRTFKKTWGESLVRYYGLGLVEFILIIIGIVSTVLLMFLTGGIPMVSYIILILGVVYIIAVIAFFNIANSIFNTALYVYATTGKAPKGYRDGVLKHAFQKKEN